MPRMPGVTFVAPRSWSSGRPAGPPRLIVIHYTAGSEGPTAAADGAAYDQRRTDGTSAHFYTDRGQIIQCVDTADRAHTALYHGNLYGIHIEQCGTAQTRAQWLDDASRATIRNTAKVCAWAMKTHGIPLVRLVDGQVRAGRGICGHGDITRGFPEDNGSHTDPGPEYPWDVLFADIKALLDPEEDDMDPSTIIPRPTNLTYPSEVAPTAWPTSGATGQPTLAYLLHAILAKVSGDGIQANAGRSADAARDTQVLTEVRQLREQLAAGGVPVDYDHLADVLAAKLAARLAT